jgi:hypothetical protein
MQEGDSMTNTKRFILCSLILLSFMVVNTESAHACSCVIPGAPDVELARSTAVFSGRVVARDEPGGLIVSSADPVEVTFEVYAVWKGPAYSTITITTARSGASCGYVFEEGEQYLVYADGSADNLTVSMCSRTQPLEWAEEDLAALGEGTTALAENPELPEGFQYWPIIILSIVAAGVLLSVGVLAVVIKRSS